MTVSSSSQFLAYVFAEDEPDEFAPSHFLKLLLPNLSTQRVSLMSSLDQATKLGMPLPQMMMILMKMMFKSLLFLKQ